jgi:hypothetical protein
MLGQRRTLTMWIARGLLLGSGVFVIGTLIFLWFAVLNPARSATATGLSVITGMTIGNPFFWAALVACLVLGVSVMASWPVRVQ